MAEESGCWWKKSSINFSLISLLLFLHKSACTLANCSSSGCSNGGSCVQIPDTDTFNCVCTSQWTGSLCSVATNPILPCSSFPCLNGGFCQNILDIYVCTCGVKWMGKNCEQSRDAAPVGMQCGSQEWKCDDGSCIHRLSLCDGGRDCWDGSDEKDCGNKDCGRLEFPCDDGQCIIHLGRCDGNEDCRDGSDEKNCASVVPNPPCSRQWDFDCGDGSCVNRNARCDRYADCQNEADEANCNLIMPDPGAKLPNEEQLPPGTPIHPPTSLNLVDILIVSCAMLMAFVAITIFVYLRRVRRMHQRYFAAVGGSPPATSTRTRHRHYRRQQGTPYRLSHHSTFCHHLPPHRCPASSNLLVSYNLHTGAEVVDRGAASADKDETDCGDEVPPAYSEVMGSSGAWTREGSETPPPAYEDLPSAFRH